MVKKILELNSAELKARFKTIFIGLMTQIRNSLSQTLPKNGIEVRLLSTIGDFMVVIELGKEVRANDGSLYLGPITYYCRLYFGNQGKSSDLYCSAERLGKRKNYKLNLDKVNDKDAIQKLSNFIVTDYLHCILRS